MTLRLRKEDGIAAVPDYVFQPPAEMTPEMEAALASINLTYVFNPYLTGPEPTDRFDPPAESMIAKCAQPLREREPKVPPRARPGTWKPR